MDLKSFFESVKEYFLDVIGFLIPGVILFLCLSFCINKALFITTQLPESHPDYFTFLFILLVYTLGYLIYGLGVLKDDIIDKIPRIKSSTTEIEEGIKAKPPFKQALEKYNTYLSSKSLSEINNNDISCRELRSKVMSFLSSDNNNKIYRFMYQSDLCKHVGNVLLLIGLLGLINNIIYSVISINIIVFNQGKAFLFYYTLFLICYILFRSARRYFYDKAIKTPFNMYMAI